MRTAAYFFTILLLFLVAQPLLISCQPAYQEPVAETGCCKKATKCDSKAPEKKTGNKDCDRATSCNPFAGCSGCQYLASSRYTYASAWHSDGLQKTITGAEALPPGYTSDRFRPPQPAC